MQPITKPRLTLPSLAVAYGEILHGNVNGLTTSASRIPTGCSCSKFLSSAKLFLLLHQRRDTGVVVIFVSSSRS